MLIQRVEMVEKLNEWAMSLGKYSQTSRGLFTVFERGFINHTAHYQDHDELQIIDLAERFVHLGIKTILLIISENQIEERIKLRDKQMKIENSQFYYREQAKKAKEIQEKMIEATKKTILPSIIINTDSMNWDEYAHKILDATNT